MIPLSFLIQQYTEFYRNATEDHQSLIFAIGASLAGIALHFLRKHPKIQKSHEITIDSYELLLLMVAPMFVGLNIIKKEYQGELNIIFIPIIGVLLTWYIVTAYRTSRPGEIEEGKPAWQFTNFFYGMLMIFFLPLIWLFTI